MASMADSVNGVVVSRKRHTAVQDPKLTRDMVPVIKLALVMGYPYTWIAKYFGGLNFGRIADVKFGRKFAEVEPAKALPSDFPVPA